MKTQFISDLNGDETFGRFYFFQVKVELDLPIYTRTTDLNNVAGFDTSDFSKKTDLDNL